MKDSLPLVRLREVLRPLDRPEVPIPGRAYRQIGVRLWGEGAYERTPLDGGETRYQTLSRVEADDVIVNKIWARNGSVAVVPETLTGCYASNEFPIFVPVRELIDPRWFHWFTKTPLCWWQCDEKSRGTSGKNRIRPERFLEIEIPLPPLKEQRQILERIDEVAIRIDAALRLRQEIESATRQLLVAACSRITVDAKYLLMAQVAPLRRRPIQVDASAEYGELGIRSFGKGTFHKPSISGTALGAKRIFQIEPGDLLFNIVFAWEGAVAVARPEDRGRVGSHRFLTCVPREGVATSSFLCFHFLTERGLQQLGEASPGGAGRNRTLRLKALEKIEVPVPPFEKQLWFDALKKKVDSVAALREGAAAELNALMPSILSKAFRGEL